jgi:predicted 2-oxoglutarate/Fe(II)-dependent dioxygenase YbiX
MSSINTKLPALLSKIKRPGSFATAGTHDLLAPTIHVDGVGPIALPLLPAQAEQLASVAEPAPYGKGQETLIDPSVRNCRQVGPDRVRITSRRWPDTLADITKRAATGLGVAEPVVAEFYKLLVYGPGSFFVSHRDTEKSPGMFATLLIVLPSHFAGGTLVVRHKGQEQRIDARAEDASECAFAAFYADCVHEVLPITEGTRLTLVYNLIRADRKKTPEPPDYEKEQTQAVTLLRAWREQPRDTSSDAPEKLVLPLEHAYTPAEIDFSTLKGADAAATGVLAAAAAQAGCDLHLALLTVEEQGEPDYDAHYSKSRRRRYYDDEDDDEDYEMGEIYERSVILSEWRRPDGAACPFTELPVIDAELAPPDALEALAPDEQHFHEATGNAGATLERTYRRAALVLWPSDRIFAVLSQGGLKNSLPYLDAMTGRWERAGAAPDGPARRDALELAGHIVSTWPSGATEYHREREKPGNAATMLALLARLADPAMISRFLNDVTAAGDYGIGDNAGVLAALDCLKPQRAGKMLEHIIGATAARAPIACAALLRHAAVRWHATADIDLRGAASRLVDSLPGDKSRDTSDRPLRGGGQPSETMVVDLIEALETIDPRLADRAAAHILAQRKTYGLDEILVPAMRELTKRDGAAVAALRHAALAHLQARTAEPLAPPADWRRDSKLGCKCEKCTALARFLDDPNEQTWRCAASEFYRSHVQTTIMNAQCDVKTTTEKRGRPYTLICTKTQASYARRARQRDKDLRDIALLMA